MSTAPHATDPAPLSRPVALYPPEPKVNFTLFGSVGDSFQVSDAAAAEIAGRGYPPLNAPDAEGGAGSGGMLVDWGRFILETQGGGGGMTARRGKQITSYGGGDGSFSVGLIAARRRFVRIFPFISLGGTGQGLTLVTEGDEAPQLSVGDGAGVFMIGLGVDLMLPLGPVRLTVGLRGGMRWLAGPPPAQDKEPAETDKQLPDRNGPFVRVLFGLGPTAERGARQRLSDG